MTPLSNLALLLFVSAVAAVDVRTHRIPNALVAIGVVLGAGSQFWIGGFAGLLQSSAGLVVGLALLLPFYAVRGFGAGDVKAMAAVGAFFAPAHAAVAVAATLIAGSVIGTVVLLASASSATSALHRVVGAIGSIAVRAGDDAAESQQRQRFPYGVAIAVGALFAMLWSSRQ